MSIYTIISKSFVFYKSDGIGAILDVTGKTKTNNYLFKNLIIFSFIYFKYFVSQFFGNFKFMCQKWRTPQFYKSDGIDTSAYAKKKKK